MTLLIDNYDSFTYNLVQLAGSINPDIRVIRNDAVPAAEIGRFHPEHIILSPGPGYPKNAGICEEVIRRMEGKVPILGVCLGHQAICEIYGAKITRARRLMHGKKSTLSIEPSSPIFKGLPAKIETARYHSLIAEAIPECLRVIAADPIGEVMAVQHRDYPTYGLQFHPESILTPLGRVIMENFLAMPAPCR